MKNNYFLQNLVASILSINNKKEMEEFLQGILTPKELVEIATRLEIVKQLKKGLPHHQIAKNLAVGVATVTRGSKEIKKGRFSNI